MANGMQVTSHPIVDNARDFTAAFIDPDSKGTELVDIRATDPVAATMLAQRMAFESGTQVRFVTQTL